MPFNRDAYTRQDLHATYNEPLTLRSRVCSLGLRCQKYQVDRHRLFAVHERTSSYCMGFSTKYRLRLAAGRCPHCGAMGPLATGNNLGDAVCPEHGQYRMGVSWERPAADPEGFFQLETNGEYVPGLEFDTQEARPISKKQYTTVGLSPLKFIPITIAIQQESLKDPPPATWPSYAAPYSPEQRYQYKEWELLTFKKAMDKARSQHFQQEIQGSPFRPTMEEEESFKYFREKLYQGLEVPPQFIYGIDYNKEWEALQRARQAMLYPLPPTLASPAELYQERYNPDASFPSDWQWCVVCRCWEPKQL